MELATRLNKTQEGERKVGRLTNREDVSFPTDHLIRLSRDEDILPDVCGAAGCISIRVVKRENVEPVAA